jgi:hypothetical protein
MTRVKTPKFSHGFGSPSSTLIEWLVARENQTRAFGKGHEAAYEELEEGGMGRSGDLIRLRWMQPPRRLPLTLD